MLLAGNLKVGKSTVFSWYIGRKREHVVYPGTGVELAAGRLGTERFARILDAPGFYSLQERSEDAFVARDLLVRRLVGGVLLVLDAKNLARGLALALQLAEFEVPVAVALNMCDEARQRGLEIDVEQLSSLLGVPVVSTVAIEGRGLWQLRRALANARPLAVRMRYPQEVESAAAEIANLVRDRKVAGRGLAYLLMVGVPRIHRVLSDMLEPPLEKEVVRSCEQLPVPSERSLDILLAESAVAQAEELAGQVTSTRARTSGSWSNRLARLSRRPATGVPIALFILLLTYFFVGWFGAGFLVDLLEGKLFGELILPPLESLVERIPWEWLRELLTGQFGLLTIGLTLSLAIVLPVLATFFFAFALMEDSGYLPRLSLLTDRMLRKIGLNGKGVLPLIMGLSCVTMAVLTTRMLDSRKQRIIATFLLILTVPCAPMLSVMMVLLADLSIWATVTLFGMLILQFLFVGVLANVLIPGERADFILELPPLRAPRIRNTLIKTGHQIGWFLKEAIPYFLLGSFILYLFDQFGALQLFREALEPVSERLLGLPAESADVFFMTMVRREAGAALLAQQASTGLYDGVQVVVTLLVMTLMIPCINSVLVMYKERGGWVASAILVTVVLYALLVGGLVNATLRWLHVTF